MRLLAAAASALLLCACGTPVVPTPGPPAQTVRGEAIGESTVRYPAGSLPAVLASDGRFRIFLTLLERDGFLLQRLLDRQALRYTLFVPTDEAILGLEREVTEQLASDPAVLTGIVERHFLARQLPSHEFTTGYLITGMTRRLSRIALVLDGEAIWFGVGQVIETDIEVARGIVHVIDAVNLGPTPDLYPIP